MVPWKRPDVARFAGGELLANAAWAGVLTYSGALLFESYAISPAMVALGLGLMATAMLPGTFSARRAAANATPQRLAWLTAFQAAAVLALGALRPGVGVTLALLAAMAFVNGWRTMLASALGMDGVPEDRVAVMSMRAAANQFGYLLGAAAGGLALALGGFPMLGLTLAALFVAAVLIHCPALVRTPTPVPRGRRPDRYVAVTPSGGKVRKSARNSTTPATAAAQMRSPVSAELTVGSPMIPSGKRSANV